MLYCSCKISHMGSQDLKTVVSPFISLLQLCKKSLKSKFKVHNYLQRKTNGIYSYQMGNLIDELNLIAFTTISYP